MIALTILALISYNLFMVLNSSSKLYNAGSASANIESLAARTVDRIADALIGASRQSLYVVMEAPQHAGEINYEMHLGYENGAIVWSDPEQIAITVVNGKVVWKENPGQDDERQVVWCNYVRDFLEGEIPNSLDDNGNGLVDEGGLSFDIDGSSVIIRLTLEREDREGNLITRTVEQRVTCRN